MFTSAGGDGFILLSYTKMRVVRVNDNRARVRDRARKKGEDDRRLLTEIDKVSSFRLGRTRMGEKQMIEISVFV